MSDQLEEANEMNQNSDINDHPIVKKQKRSTIDEAMRAADLAEYITDRKDDETEPTNEPVTSNSSGIPQNSNLYNSANTFNLNIFNSNIQYGLIMNQNNLQNPTFLQNQGFLQQGLNLYNLFQQTQVNPSTIYQIQHHQALQKRLQALQWQQQQKKMQYTKGHQKYMNRNNLEKQAMANNGQKQLNNTMGNAANNSQALSSINNNQIQPSGSTKMVEEFSAEQISLNEAESKGDKTAGEPPKKSRWGKKNPQNLTGGLGGLNNGSKLAERTFIKDMPALINNLLASLSQETPANEESEWKKNFGLSEYFRRSFSKCVTNEEANLMEGFLKNIVNNAKNNNELETKDWNSFPLPTLPREKNISSNPKIDLSILAHINSVKKAELEVDSKGDLTQALKLTDPQNKNLLMKNLKPSEWFSVERGTNLTYKTNNQTTAEQKNEILAKINKNLAKKPLLIKKKGALIMTPGSEGGMGKNMDKTPNATKLLQHIQKNKEQNKFTTEEDKRRDERRKRFHSEVEGKKETPTIKKENVFTGIVEGEDFDFEMMVEKWRIKGTSTKLEKPYLRLTSAPDPSTVRPEKILKEALKMLLKKWNNGNAEYPYISEQFRSLRQDIMIQHIRNKFTVKAYEHNARISLESHDLAQFKQCQTRLSELYKEGHKGQRYEFFCYRIIYLVLNDLVFELNKLLSELTDDDLNQKEVKIALDLRNNYQVGNVFKFFQIYKTAPNMSQYLMDIYINRLRIWGLKLLTNAFGEKCDLDYLTELLAFNDRDHCISFLEESGGVLNPDKSFLMNKESYRVYANHSLLGLKRYKNTSNN